MQSISRGRSALRSSIGHDACTVIASSLTDVLPLAGSAKIYEAEEEAAMHL